MDGPVKPLAAWPEADPGATLSQSFLTTTAPHATFVPLEKRSCMHGGWIAVRGLLV
jgi:hypothetical protein